MDWTQTLTIIGAMSGLVFYLHKDLKTDMKKIDANHREDIKNMDDKWAKLFGLFVEQLRK